MALKSYYEWKEGGGKGVWKFSGNWKPHSASKQFVRKSSDLFVNSLSRNSSTVENSDVDLSEMVCRLTTVMSVVVTVYFC